MPKVTYTCTCPDFSQQHPGKLVTKGISSVEEREWNNIKTKQIECKHIIAVRLEEREFDFSNFPTDVPLDKLLPRMPERKGTWTDKTPQQNRRHA